jgi:hypothetical protein
VEYQTREQTFADPRLGNVTFMDYAAEVLSTLDMADGTRTNYRQTLGNWVHSWAGSLEHTASLW